jgi:hypothetical protein
MGDSGVTPDMIRSIFPTAMSDEGLNLLIAQAEAELEVMIGPLVGPISQSFTGLGMTRFILSRRPDAESLLLSTPSGPVSEDDWEIGTDPRLVKNVAVLPWDTPSATYDTDDLELVQASVIDLVIMHATAISGGGFRKERLGEYSYELFGPAELEVTRRAIWRRFRYPGYGPAYTSKLIPVGASDP